VGFLLRRDGEEVQVAQSISASGLVGEILTIPATCVREVQTFARSGKKTRRK
jgi:hypothetical protein